MFVGHGVMFINDKRPRATADGGGLQTEDDWELLPTTVEDGASIGSGAVDARRRADRRRSARRRRRGRDARRAARGDGGGRAGPRCAASLDAGIAERIPFAGPGHGRAPRLPVDQPDPWQAALDRLDQLRRRLEEVGAPEDDELARALMREVELDRTTGFIVLLDRAGTVLDVNAGALFAGGLERAAVIGSLLWQAPWWRDSARAQEETARAVRSVVHEGAHARFDVDVWIEAEGTARGTLDLSLRPLRSRDGLVAFVLADGRNVTDRTRAERRITRQHAEVTVLNDRLALLVEHHRRMMSNLSHDLRMPIQVILTRAERILEETRDSVVRAETRGIRLAADRALAQMESMLQQARRGETEDLLHPSQGDLAATVRFAAEEFAPLAERRGVTLELDLPEQLHAAYDPERVSQVVANLIANAVRFSPEAGVIRCSLRVHGSLAHLEVADSGPGIAADERKRIFGALRDGGRRALPDRPRARDRARERRPARRHGARRQLAGRRRACSWSRCRSTPPRRAGP